MLGASTEQEPRVDMYAAGHDMIAEMMLTRDAWGEAWMNGHEKQDVLAQNHRQRMVPGIDGERVKRTAKVKTEMIGCDLMVTRMVFQESMMSSQQMTGCDQTTHGMIPIEPEVVGGI
jgi:hypothetical protein